MVTKDSVPEIGVEQIDAVLEYLPLFEEQDYEFGQWEAPEGQLPHFSFSPEVDEFISTLYEQGIMIRFDWPTWSEEAKRYQSNRAALESADLLTVRKLLTTHVRAERFEEGHLARIFDEGLLTALLQRLKQIRDEMVVLTSFFKPHVED